MRKNIQERRKELERQKIALLGKEKVLKEVERKERTRKLIELGGLIAKAHLDHLDGKTLYGALLSLEAKKEDPNILKHWYTEGNFAFAREAKKEKQEGVLLTIHFKEQPSPEVRTAVRALGLRWNGVRQEWQGRAFLQTAEALANQYGGILTLMEE